MSPCLHLGLDTEGYWWRLEFERKWEICYFFPSPSFSRNVATFPQLLFCCCCSFSKLLLIPRFLTVYGWFYFCFPAINTHSYCCLPVWIFTNISAKICVCLALFSLSLPSVSVSPVSLHSHYPSQCQGH